MQTRGRAFHRDLSRAEWRTEREAAARQAPGLEGLTLPEAKGRDVCAVCADFCVSPRP